MAVKLNLGCGADYKQGYINIDRYAINFKTDRSFDCNLPLDFSNESVEEILAIHLLEHLSFTGLNRVMASWYRVLTKGGKLIIEIPDFNEILKMALKDKKDDKILTWIFGLQDRPGETHFWGWNKERLKGLLEKSGFKDIKFVEPQNFRKDEAPCLRCEATK